MRLTKISALCLATSLFFSVASDARPFRDKLNKATKDLENTVNSASEEVSQSASGLEKTPQSVSGTYGNPSTTAAIQYDNDHCRYKSSAFFDLKGINLGMSHQDLLTFAQSKGGNWVPIPEGDPTYPRGQTAPFEQSGWGEKDSGQLDSLRAVNTEFSDGQLTIGGLPVTEVNLEAVLTRAPSGGNWRYECFTKIEIRVKSLGDSASSDTAKLYSGLKNKYSAYDQTGDDRGARPKFAAYSSIGLEMLALDDLGSQIAIELKLNVTTFDVAAKSAVDDSDF